MTHWRETLENIRHAQTEIMRSAPFKDFGLVPNPAASETAIAATEQRLGFSLPRSYREFLLEHDGWPRFYEGATLLGTSSLGRRDYEDVVEAVFRAAETPVPEIGPPPSRVRRQRPLLPFGIDLQGTTLFAFDLSAEISAPGELVVVAWVNELGFTFGSFAAFLESVEDWLALDREFATPALRRAG